MPREMTMTSTEPVTLDALVRAGSAVDGTLAPRTLFGGWALQLVNEQDVAVLTIELSRRLTDRWDAERLLGTRLSDGQGAELWWTEATAPWGPAGEPGVAILRQLAGLMSARLVVEEGR